LPDFSDEELLAIEADRRRRVTAAFRLGSQATAGSPGSSWLFPLAIGIAVAIAIALLLGIGTLVQNASHTTAPVATPSSR
jgi:Tfp pilus assembly protein PilN